MLLAGDRLRLDACLLWARSGGEAEDNKVLCVYGLAAVEEPLVVPSPGAEML